MSMQLATPRTRPGNEGEAKPALLSRVSLKGRVHLSEIYADESHPLTRLGLRAPGDGPCG